jgi:hypothetical protein
MSFAASVFICVICGWFGTPKNPQMTQMFTDDGTAPTGHPGRAACGRARLGRRLEDRSPSAPQGIIYPGSGAWPASSCARAAARQLRRPAPAVEQRHRVPLRVDVPPLARPGRLAAKGLVGLPDGGAGAPPPQQPLRGGVEPGVGVFLEDSQEVGQEGLMHAGGRLAAAERAQAQEQGPTHGNVRLRAPAFDKGRGVGPERGKGVDEVATQPRVRRVPQ